jgi:hypothetical protein
MGVCVSRCFLLFGAWSASATNMLNKTPHQSAPRHPYKEHLKDKPPNQRHCSRYHLPFMICFVCYSLTNKLSELFTSLSCINSRDMASGREGCDQGDSKCRERARTW